MAIATLQRDPYARADLCRQSERGAHECRWCGARLTCAYRYAWVGDTQHSARVQWSPTFCSVGCYRAYTGDVR